MRKDYRTTRQKDRDRDELWADVMLVAGVVFTVLLLTLTY